MTDTTADGPRILVRSSPDDAATIAELRARVAELEALLVRAGELLAQVPAGQVRGSFSILGEIDRAVEGSPSVCIARPSYQQGDYVCTAGTVGVIAGRADHDPIGWHVRWPNGEMTTVREPSLLRVAMPTGSNG